MRGQVVKLDRGFPLVRCEDGTMVRCEHATALVKTAYSRAVIGDYVDVSIPEGHDKGIIEDIAPRSREFVRKDPTERAVPQVLAANFDRVLVAQPLADVNLKRLERELVLAHETGAEVTVVLTKADLAEDERQVEAVRAAVRAIAGDVGVLTISSAAPESVEAVRELIPSGTTAVLIGKSGVGKSSLVNLLVGEDVLEIGDVREGDGKGRHTTVSREIVEIPGGGCIVDMPGVRGLGLSSSPASARSTWSSPWAAARRSTPARPSRSASPTTATSGTSSASAPCPRRKSIHPPPVPYIVERARVPPHPPQSQPQTPLTRPHARERH